MKTLYDKYKWARFVIAALVITLGVIILILVASNKTADVAKTISLISGIFCFVYAALAFGFAIALESRNKLVVDTLSAGILAGIGMGLVWDGGAVGAGIIYILLDGFLPWILIFAGAFYVVQFIVEVANRYNPANWLFHLVAGAALLTVGIILEVKHGATDFVFIMLGITIILVGILTLVNAINHTRKN